MMQCVLYKGIYILYILYKIMHIILYIIALHILFVYYFTICV